MSSCHHTIISSYHHIIRPSYHHIIVSSYHHIIISSGDTQETPRRHPEDPEGPQEAARSHPGGTQGTQRHSLPHCLPTSHPASFPSSLPSSPAPASLALSIQASSPFILFSVTVLASGQRPRRSLEFDIYPQRSGHELFRSLLGFLCLLTPSALRGLPILYTPWTPKSFPMELGFRLSLHTFFNKHDKHDFR